MLHSLANLCGWEGSGPITFGEMRASGVRDVMVYCRDHKCSHSTTMSAERWAEVSGTAPCRCEAAI